MEFQVTNKIKYGPFLQELSYIRPLRMLSPASFVDAEDPQGANSCHVGWGTIAHPDHVNVTCAGILEVSGTGPFQLAGRTSIISGQDTLDDEVIFVRNTDYWDGVPNIETLVIKRYETSEAVKAALLSGELDIVWGAGVLTDADISEIQASDELQGQILVNHSEDIQNVIMLLNSGKAPLDDVNLRRTIIHAINKAAIVNDDLAGLQKPVDNVFPIIAPYCDVDLTPRFDYDFEEALLLSCDGVDTNSGGQSDTAGDGGDETEGDGSDETEGGGSDETEASDAKHAFGLGISYMLLVIAILF